MLKTVSKVGMPARKAPAQGMNEMPMEAEGEMEVEEPEAPEAMDLSALTDDELLAEVQKRGLKV